MTQKHFARLCANDLCTCPASHREHCCNTCMQDDHSGLKIAECGCGHAECMAASKSSESLRGRNQSGKTMDKQSSSNVVA